MPKILIVDDNEDSRMVLGQLLIHSGYTVLEVAEGESALELVRKERPDLALVDLLMPVVDGFEFVHRLRQEDGPHAATPVIFITAAYLPTDVLPLAELCNVSIVLARPTPFATILKAVAEALSAAPPILAPTENAPFRLQLLGLLSRTLSKNIQTVLPSVVEYIQEETRIGEERLGS